MSLAICAWVWRLKYRLKSNVLSSGGKPFNSLASVSR
jgi:hypothetical protein